MNEQQTNQTKQPGAFKLYAIIVAAILTCAAVIGAFFAINAFDQNQRRHKAAMAQVEYETLQIRKHTMGTVAMMLKPNSEGWNLYLKWLQSADKGTTEEQVARLNELERKLKVIEPTMAQYFSKDTGQ